MKPPQGSRNTVAPKQAGSSSNMRNLWS